MLDKKEPPRGDAEALSCRSRSKHWVSYDGPPDFRFVVLNAPKKELKEGGSGREYSNLG